jgi:NAD(P) transhydrogenase subunit alpha
VRAVVEASHAFGRFFSGQTTAAGKVAPAKVFIIGGGVAGLAAAAQAKGMGAITRGFDVRAAVKEQWASLGAEALEVAGVKEAGEGAGGYAKEMSKEFAAAQAVLVAKQCRECDVVITTALIPGRAAPQLVSEAMVKSMRHGSVIVDLAVERGGNVALSQAGKTIVTDNGVTILGPLNLAGQIAASASALYAKNLFAFVETMIDKKEKTLAVQWGDELVKATLLTRDGAIIHPQFQPKS